MLLSTRVICSAHHVTDGRKIHGPTDPIPKRIIPNHPLIFLPSEKSSGWKKSGKLFILRHSTPEYSSDLLIDVIGCHYPNDIMISHSDINNPIFHKFPVIADLSAKQALCCF